jgi:hypothetical protein
MNIKDPARWRGRVPSVSEKYEPGGSLWMPFYTAIAEVPF